MCSWCYFVLLLSWMCFKNNAFYSALPSMVLSLGITESKTTWVMSAFQLTFMSFLLIVSIRSLHCHLRLILLWLIYFILCRVKGSVMFTIWVGYLFWLLHVLFWTPAYRGCFHHRACTFEEQIPGSGILEWQNYCDCASSTDRHQYA